MSDLPSLNIGGMFAALADLGEPEFVSEEFQRGRYQCVKDGHLLIPPVMQLSCGHRICFNPCLDNLRHSLMNSRCPGGEEECNEVDVTAQGHVLPDVSSTKELARAKIWCVNKNNGCPEQMSWKQLENHLRNCLYKLVNCRYTEKGCQEKKPASLIEDHERNCLYVMFTCQHCGESLLKLNRELHERACIIQQGRCPLSGIGCDFTGNSIESLQEHLRENIVEHLSLLGDEFDRRRDSHAQLSEEMSAISPLDELLVKVKHTLMEVKKKLDPKLKHTQKVVGKNSEALYKLAEVQEKFKPLQPLQETAKVLERRLKKLESDQPVLDVPPAIANNLQHIDERCTEHDKMVREMDLKFQCVENTSYDGSFIWKVTGYSEHKQRAVSGDILSLYSQPFFNDKFGYKMCLRLYPNGDGMGKGSHISLYLVLMKGEMDALLPWPFKQKVSFTLLDQDTHRRHVTDNFRPDPTSTSFHKPKSEMNTASGLPLFLEQAKVESSTYLKEDCVFIKVDIDPKVW